MRKALTLNESAQLDEPIKLDKEQIEFVEYYMSADVEFSGNGTRAYMKAFKTDNYKSAQSGASRLLNNPEILKAISLRLDLAGFNNAEADKELLFLIKQHSDKKTKMNALKEYNKLKGRVIDKPQANLVMNFSLTQIFDKAQEPKNEPIDLQPE